MKKATEVDYESIGLYQSGEHERVLVNTSNWFEKLLGMNTYEWLLPEEVK